LNENCQKDFEARCSPISGSAPDPCYRLALAMVRSV